MRKLNRNLIGTTMHRFGKNSGLFEKIRDDNTIEMAMRASLVKHKYQKDMPPEYNAAQIYMIEHWDEVKNQVREIFASEEYNFYELHKFKVYEPKERIIHCPQLIPDKIIMICTYIVLRDCFYSKFVRNTYNCIKGRGIHDAKRAIEKIMREHPDWYYVQTDITKFYPTLRHDVLKSDLAKIFKDKRILKLLYAIIDVFHEDVSPDGVEIGIAIGVNMSQLMAIMAIVPILRDINEKWKYPCVDFTDDVFVAIPTKEKCHEFIKWYINACSERGMKVKSNYKIAPMRVPLKMIGYDFRLDSEGNQYTLLGKGIKNRMKKRVLELESLNLSDDEWKQKMASYYGWCKHAKCVNLMRKVYGDKFKLFDKNMQSYKEVRENEIGDFGIPKKCRVSILNVIGSPICFEDAKIVKIVSKNKLDGKKKVMEKISIKFRKVECGEPVGESTYLISGSGSLKDRALYSQQSMPFIGTIVEQKSEDGGIYYVIE